MQNSSADATWEELYDSGQLDQQLAHLNLNRSQQIFHANLHGPQHGLVMRPLLPEQPQQALTMPTTHHVAKATGHHSMALFGSNPGAIVPSNHVVGLAGPPPGNMQQNGYPINHHISPPPNMTTNSDFRPSVQHRYHLSAPAGQRSNVQNSHDSQPRPLMSMMAQTHGGYPQGHPIQTNQQNMLSQAANQAQSAIHLPKQIPQGPTLQMQNNSMAAPRPTFQSPPPLRIATPDGSYQMLPYHHGPPGAIVLPHLPLEPRPLGHIPIDMSVPPPRIPLNGNSQMRAPNIYYQNGFGPNAPTNKSHVHKTTKNKNVKSNFNASSSNTQIQQTASQFQPVFTVSSSIPQEQFNADAAAAYNSVQVESDYPRTMYRPPEPKVTILKRPVSTPSNLSLQASGSVSGASDNSDEGGNTSNTGGGINNLRTKSLKQREEEYAQARLRILGSTEPEISSELDISSNDSSVTSTSQSTPNVHLAQKSSTKNRLSGGSSLTVISNTVPQNGKNSSLNNHSNQNIERLSKGADSSKGLNVGQGSDS